MFILSNFVLFFILYNILLILKYNILSLFIYFYYFSSERMLIEYPTDIIYGID